LDLENNKLDAESAFAIAAGLQKLPSLRRLDLVSVSAASTVSFVTQHTQDAE
jgi:hypothetical protein